MPDGSATASHNLRVLALGVNWFQAGSGGLDRVFHDLASTLPQAGIDLRGLVLGPPDVAAATEYRIQAFGVPGCALTARLLAARRALANALASDKPDVLAVHFALFAAPSLDLLRRQKLVVHFHGPWADEAAEEGASRLGVALRHRLECSVYKRASQIIVLSSAFGELARSRYGVDASRIRVVPGSVDLRRFAPALSREAARAALGWPSKGRVLLAVRRLVKRMGLDRLIEAMPAIRAAIPDTTLVIAGTGAEEADLRARASATGLGLGIRFAGFMPEADLPLAYRAADINVVPSRVLEGFGLTAAEALAAGTPSMVAPIGGLPEVVAPLMQDLVFRSTSTDDIVAGLVAALRGHLPNEAACRAYAAARFSPDTAARNVAAVYREAA